jgi:hypothetical protein
MQYILLKEDSLLTIGARSQIKVTQIQTAFKKCSYGHTFKKPTQRKSIWPPAALNSHAKDMYQQAGPSCKWAEISTAEKMNKKYINKKITNFHNTGKLLFGTDPDRNRVTWETPSSEAIPSVKNQ